MFSKEQIELNSKIEDYSQKFAQKVKEAGQPISLKRRFELNYEFYQFMTTTNNEILKSETILYDTKISLQASSKAKCNEKIVESLGMNIATNELLAFQSCQLPETIESPAVNYKNSATIETEFNKLYTTKVAPQLQDIKARYPNIKDCPMSELVVAHQSLYESFLGAEGKNFQNPEAANKSPGQILAEGYCKIKLQEELGMALSINLTKMCTLYPDVLPTLEPLYTKFPIEVEAQLNETNQYFGGQISRQVTALLSQYPDGKFSFADSLNLSGQITTGFIDAQKKQITEKIPTITSKEDQEELSKLIESLAIKETTRLIGNYFGPEITKPYVEAQKYANAEKAKYPQLQENEKLETRKQINKKFDEALLQMEKGLRGSSLDADARERFIKEAKEFITEEKKRFSNEINLAEQKAIDLQHQQFAVGEMTKGTSKAGKQASAEHISAISKLLASPSAKGFVDRYNEDSVFQGAINNALTESADISKNPDKMKYLQNMVENPELFQQVFNDVRPKSKTGEDIVFPINDKFVQKFNKQFEVVRVQPKEATIQRSSVLGSNQLAVANPAAVAKDLEEFVDRGRSTVAADSPALAPQEKPKASVTEQEFAAKATKMRQEIIDVENVITRGLFDLVTANGGKINFEDKTFTNAIDVYLNTEVKKVEKGANEQTVQSIKATQTGIENNIKELEDRGADKKACDSLRAEITGSCESFQTALTTKAGIEGLFADLLKRESLKSIPLNKKEEKGGPSAKAGDIRQLVMDEKREIADKLFPAITIPKGFASVLFTNPQIVSDVLRPIVNNRIIEAFSNTENGQKILDETKLTPDNIQKFGQKVGDDIAAYCVAKQSVEALRTNGKKISPETENQIIKDLAPKLSTLGSQYLQDNQGRLTEELAGNIAKEQTVISKVFGSFKISAESLVKIDVSQEDKIDASILSPNLTPQEQAIIGGVATSIGGRKPQPEIATGSPPLEISAPDSNKLLGKQAPVITVLNASSNLPKQESTLSSTTPVTKAVVPPPPPLKPARDNQATPVLTDKQRAHRDAQKQLLKAASEGNATEVSSLLQTQKANLTREDKGEALRIAAGIGDSEMVEAILKNANDISSRDEGEALRIAAGKGDNEMVKAILKNTNDISSQDKGEALRIAAAETDKTPEDLKAKKPAVVKTLLGEKNISIEDRAEAHRRSGNETRKQFSQKEQEDFKKMGKQGHNLRDLIRDYDQKQPDKKIMGAKINPPVSKTKQKDMIQVRLQKATLHDKIEGLRIAAKHGKTDIVKVLLQDKDIKKDSRGLGEALRVAAKYGHKDVVDTLLDKAGKDISSRDKGEANREAKDAKHEGIAGAIKEHMKEDYNKRHTPPSRPAPIPGGEDALLKAIKRAEVESQRSPKGQEKQNRPPNSLAPGKKYPPDIQRVVDKFNTLPVAATRNGQRPHGPHIDAINKEKQRGKGGSNVNHH